MTRARTPERAQGPAPDAIDIEGDGWRIELIQPGRLAMLYLRDEANKRYETRAHPYRLRWYWKLGWQAWYRDEPVTGYLPGELLEIIPALVEELKAGEVEDKIVPPKPRVDAVALRSEQRLAKWKENHERNQLELAQMEEVVFEKDSRGRTRVKGRRRARP